VSVQHTLKQQVCEVSADLGKNNGLDVTMSCPAVTHAHLYTRGAILKIPVETLVMVDHFY